MRIKILSRKKTRNEEDDSFGYSVETVKAEDEKGKIGYYNRLTKRLADGECLIGEWHPIDKSAYDLEDD